MEEEAKGVDADKDPETFNVLQQSEDFQELRAIDEQNRARPGRRCPLTKAARCRWIGDCWFICLLNYHERKYRVALTTLFRLLRDISSMKLRIGVLSETLCAVDVNLSARKESDRFEASRQRVCSSNKQQLAFSLRG